MCVLASIDSSWTIHFRCLPPSGGRWSAWTKRWLRHPRKTQTGMLPSVAACKVHPQSNSGYSSNATTDSYGAVHSCAFQRFVSSRPCVFVPGKECQVRRLLTPVFLVYVALLLTCLHSCAMSSCSRLVFQRSRLLLHPIIYIKCGFSAHLVRAVELHGHPGRIAPPCPVLFDLVVHPWVCCKSRGGNEGSCRLSWSNKPCV